MDKEKTMTSREIHEFGIQVVCEEMARDGFEIMGANPDPAMTPQIVARKNGRLCFVLVRTDVYPNKGKLAGDREFFQNLEHAERNGALCYFAGVGICRAGVVDSGGKEGKSADARDAGFFVDFNGLQAMTTLNRMHVVHENGFKLIQAKG